MGVRGGMMWRGWERHQGRVQCTRRASPRGGECDVMSGGECDVTVLCQHILCDVVIVIVMNVTCGESRGMNVRYAVCCGMQRGVVRGSLRSRECVQVQVCGEREIVEDRHLQLFERRYHLRGRLLAPATPDDVERARKLPGRAESPVA